MSLFTSTVACAAALVLGAATLRTGTPLRSTPCAPLTLQTSPALSTVAPFFASWNVDSSRNRAFFDTDWTAPALVSLASAIGGASSRIRFGGSGNDALNYAVGGPACPPPSTKAECLNATTAEGLFTFAAATGSAMIFGLNIRPAGSPFPPHAPWNSTNAASLLRWSLARGTPPFALELGNEQNDAMTAAEQAAAFAVLSTLLDDVFSVAPSLRPALVGPDTHGFHNASDAPANAPLLAYLADFASSMASLGVHLDALTHHEYIEVDEDSVVDPAYLDNTRVIGEAVVAAVRAVAPELPIWAGEIGPHNGDGTTSANSVCSGNHVCGRFGSTLWYADALGAKAAAGYSAFMRQDLVGADYALINTTLPASPFPTPDYWLLKLWRDNVSNRTAVLAAGPPPGGPRTTRVYAFCCSTARSGSGSEVALLLLNLDNSSTVCVGPPAASSPGGTMRVFTLTPAGAGGVTAVSAALNGVELALGPGGSLPPLPPATQSVGALTLPPLSVTIAVVPLDASGAGVCGGD